MIKKYKKKPVEIEAVQYIGDNIDEVEDFVDQKLLRVEKENGISLGIPTLEGMMTASIGDYIIRGISGEFYPCKPDIFNKTYDVV